MGGDFHVKSSPGKLVVSGCKSRFLAWYSGRNAAIFYRQGMSKGSTQSKIKNAVFSFQSVFKMTSWESLRNVVASGYSSFFFPISLYSSFLLTQEKNQN